MRMNGWIVGMWIVEGDGDAERIQLEWQPSQFNKRKLTFGKVLSL